MKKIFLKILRSPVTMIRWISLMMISFLPLIDKIKILEKVREKNIGYLDYKYKITVSVDSLTIFSRLGSCRKEPGTIEWIENNIQKNDVFYDIGANIGAYSLVACANLKKNIKIYAFEPGLSTFPILCKNILDNNYADSIIPINVPLGSKTRNGVFVYQNLSAGAAEHIGVDSNYRVNTAQAKEIKCFNQRVLIYTLDDFIKLLDIELPNHIKIDADGYEKDILLGATKTLNAPELETVQIEIDRSSGNEEIIVNLMEKAGFMIIKKNQHWDGPIYDFIFRKENKGENHA